MEPVNSAAVDERREHPQPVPQRVTDRAHRQHKMEVCLHALDEEVVHRHRCRIDLAPLLPGHRLHFLDQVDLLVGGEQVRDVRGVQDHVDVLHVGLLSDLLVAEEEHRLRAVRAGPLHHRLEVLAPVKERVSPGSSMLNENFLKYL